MKIVGHDQTSVTVQLSRDELVMVNNALNEVCNGVNIDDVEFVTRLAFDRATVRALLSQFSMVFETWDR